MAILTVVSDNGYNANKLYVICYLLLIQQWTVVSDNGYNAKSYL